MESCATQTRWFPTTRYPNAVVETTRYANEACLRSLAYAGLLDPVVLRPTVVFGKGGDSSALFMNLARLPVVVFPAPMLTARIQPVSVHDLAAAVVALLGPALQRTGTIACTGPGPLAMADFAARPRQQQGHAPALVPRLPLPLSFLPRSRRIALAFPLRATRLAGCPCWRTRRY